MQSTGKLNLRMIVFVAVSLILLVVGSAFWIRWVRCSGRSGGSYDLQDWLADSRARALAAAPSENLEDVRRLIDAGCFVNPESGIASCAVSGVLNEERLLLLSRCKFVRSVIVFGQQLDRDLTPLTTLPQLECLALRQCSAPWEGYWPLGDITTLRRLLLASSSVCDEDLKHILGKVPLVSLDVGYNPDVTEVGLEALKDVVSLQELDVTSTKVGQLDFVRCLTDLRELHLCGTLIEDQDLTPLAELPKLEVLDLGWTFVSDKSLDVLTQIKTLRMIDVRGTGITDAGGQKLQQALPNASVSVGRQ